jgi:hypothetical protein
VGALHTQLQGLIILGCMERIVMQPHACRGWCTAKSFVGHEQAGVAKRTILCIPGWRTTKLQGRRTINLGGTRTGQAQIPCPYHHIVGAGPCACPVGAPPIWVVHEPDRHRYPRPYHHFVGAGPCACPVGAPPIYGIRVSEPVCPRPAPTITWYPE